MSMRNSFGSLVGLLMDMLINSDDTQQSTSIELKPEDYTVEPADAETPELLTSGDTDET